ncbi:MAG: type II toxin-antitoxin system RelE/ParE family toxin [Pirellulales bacterium]
MATASRTEAANRDLINIAYQIGIESGRPLVADQIVDELIDRCESLAESAGFARTGTAADELGSGIRLISHRRWVIIFRYVDEGVLILRIADGAQDYLSWKLAGD